MFERPGGSADFNVVGGVSNADFGLRTCFENEESKNKCRLAIIPLYHKLSAVFLIMIAVTLLLNLIIFILYIKGRSNLGKVDLNVVFMTPIQMLFYYLTLQLIISNILYCIGFAITRETWMIFYEDPFDDALTADLIQLLTYISGIISNFYSQMLPLGVVVLALHRLSIFVFGSRGFFEKNFLVVIISSQWILIIAITILLTVFECQFSLMVEEEDLEFQSGIPKPISFVSNYTFSCEAFANNTGIYSVSGQIYEAIQVALPGVDMLIYIIIVLHLIITQGCSFIKKASIFLLVPSFLLFLVIEASSLMGLFILTSTTKIAHAIVVKRIVNIIDLAAASLIPIIIFSTNSEIRQMLIPKRKSTISVVRISSELRSRPKSVSPHRSTHVISHHS